MCVCVCVCAQLAGVCVCGAVYKSMRGAVDKIVCETGVRLIKLYLVRVCG